MHASRSRQNRRSRQGNRGPCQDAQLAFIAGGTDLLGLMKDRAALPERLLDINDLPDMARIEALPNGGLRIGALARMSDVAAHPEVRRRFPVIAEACCSPHPASCATWRRSVATSCSARVAPISATKMGSLATSGALAPAARLSTASIAITPSSGGRTPASLPMLPMWRWHSPRSMPRSSCAARMESDRFRSPSSIACPAARRSETTSSAAAT